MSVAQGRSYFSASQPEFFSEDCLKTIWFDIRGGGRYFRTKMAIMKRREKKLSPFEVEVAGFRVPVTPLENPKYKRSSFHILRLFNSKNSMYRVDLLMQDIDLYFVAFRRQQNNQWTEWFVFEDTDAKVERFLGTTSKVHMRKSYPEAKSWLTPGGSRMTLRDVFLELTSFPTSRRVSNAFKKAIYSVMVIFCEVRRLRFLLLEISRRMDNQLPPEELSECHFNRIHSWGSASGIVLDAYNRKSLALGTKLPVEWETVGLKYIGCLIGAEGELLLLKFNERYVRENDKDFNFQILLEDPRSAVVPDHDFDE